MSPQFVSERDEQKPRQELHFLRSAAVILLLTATAKAVSVFGTQSILEKIDPLFWVLKNRELLVLVATLEAVVAVLLLSKASLPIKRGSLIWLCINFLLYRMGLWIIDAPIACKCLGDLADRIGLSDSQASWVMLGTLGYMLGGSLFFFWRSRSELLLQAPVFHRPA
ncbi:MAG: hypothetical protein NTY84_05185 [Verrucomicrobia bacterium]|nr:hypothetical protein [Verrucomicrobiota bacterium]